jgi:hypothetical protein
MSLRDKIVNATPSIAVITATIIATVTLVYLLKLYLG